MIEGVESTAEGPVERPRVARGARAADPEPYLSAVEAERAVEAVLRRAANATGGADDALRRVMQRLLSTTHEFERRMRNAERDAVMDSLTGLGNRRQWRAALRAAEERCRRGADDVVVAVIDLDGFKEINDELGHAAGDEILRRLAITLSAEVRGGDTVARTGGDEFAVLAFGTSDAQALTARLELALAASGISASVGAASRRSSGSLDEAWVRADEAMYAAKAHQARDSKRPRELR